LKELTDVGTPNKRTPAPRTRLIGTRPDAIEMQMFQLNPFNKVTPHLGKYQQHHQRRHLVQRQSLYPLLYREGGVSLTAIFTLIMELYREL
jgi:hypothetical protein